MNMLKGLWASMMELIAPTPKGFVKKVFRKKVEKPVWLQQQLQWDAIAKREKRMARNIENQKRGAYKSY